MVRIVCSIVALVLLAPAWAAAAEKPAPLDAQSRDFDQLHLDLRLRVEPQEGRIHGRAALSFQSEVDGLKTLRLHAEGMKILAVTDADARGLPFEHRGGVLAITLPSPLPRGQGKVVHIAYRASPRRGLWFHGPTERHPHVPLLVYSQGQRNDNRHWIPCYDLPDDRFSFDLHLEVPEGLDTVSNGVRVGTSEGGAGFRTDHWSFTDEAPSYLISLVVAALDQVRETWKGVELEYNAPRGHGAWLPSSLGETPAMVAFFSDWLDAPYPWRRYAQTYVWDFLYGGMENVTATTLNMRALHPDSTRPNYEASSLVAHELAHMWFGDLLTCRTWNDIWLNEGFATYLTDLYFEHRDGHDAFLLRRRKQNRGYMDGTPNPAALKLQRSPRGDRPLELFGGKEYNRGAAILHMLRLELGDALFRDAIRTYLRTHRGGSATSEDLRHAIERVAGRDLKWFFDQWVYGAGYPVLHVAWNAKSGRVVVRQTQERRGGQGLFRLTLPVRAGPGGSVKKLKIRRGRQVFDLEETKGAPYLRVGVGGDLLARIKVEQGRRAWEQMLLEDPDAAGGLDAVHALEEHGEAAHAALSQALREAKSWAVRRAVADALGRMGTGVGDLARAARDDSDPRVRESALAALGGFGRAEVAATLLEACRKETHDYARAAAARSLGRVQADGAHDALLGLLATDSHGEVVRIAALDGLASTGDVRTPPLAHTYLDYAWSHGAQSRLRQKALDVILALAPDARETREALVGLLDDPYHAMRRKAATACATYTVREARAGLEKLKKHDQHWSVRRAAGKALDALNK